eukprot:TRINITY_DN1946_c0_g1_i2.p1 TRINITY_DN1946_c0_g1~~TRINITY_DN1946_c0_g1_i2.p1  ORF type:complete len:378 (+),score=134.34 TRINITY_DN1946_c0_g1_i2:125-1135(+)
MGQVFQGVRPVISMDFHEQGELVVTAHADSSITLINALEGKIRKTVHCQKYGVGLVRFTHHDQSVLVTSDNSGNDHAVRYLSLYDNKFLRFFQGHTDKVVSVAMSPVDDCFMTGSTDRSVRLWNLSAPECLGVLQFPLNSSAPHVAYDPSGLVFAATASIGAANFIKLYDARNYEQGPFNTYTLQHNMVADFLCKRLKNIQRQQAQALARARWTNLKFSADGMNILVSTDASLIIMLDAYECSVKQVFLGHVNDNGSELDACFTADAQHVLSGSEDSQIYAWRTEDGALVSTLRGHVGSVGLVACSPKFEVVASACINTALWLRQQPAGATGAGAA